MQSSTRWPGPTINLVLTQAEAQLLADLLCADSRTGVRIPTSMEETAGSMRRGIEYAINQAKAGHPLTRPAGPPSQMVRATDVGEWIRAHNVSKTRAAKARRYLWNRGIISSWDAEEKVFAVLVTRKGREVCENAMNKALGWGE